MAGSAPALAIHGERFSGQDVRTQNTTAVMAVANILKTSLGPVGLDKVRPRLPATEPVRPRTDQRRFRGCLGTSPARGCDVRRYLSERYLHLIEVSTWSLADAGG